MSEPKKRRMVSADDDIYVYDRRWLGPADLGWTGFFNATYTQWGLFGSGFLSSTVVLELAFGHTPQAAVGVLLWASVPGYLLAKFAGERIDRDKPLASVIQASVLPARDRVQAYLDRNRTQVATTTITYTANGPSVRFKSAANSDALVGVFAPGDKPGPRDGRPWTPGRRTFKVRATPAPIAAKPAPVRPLVIPFAKES